MSNSLSEREEIVDIRRCLAAARSELLLIKAALHARRMKFNPDQPRVPAGQREGGQWTSVGGAGGSSDNTRRVDASIGSIGASSDQDIQPIASKKVVTLDYSRALTGISTIDNATKALSETLAETMEKVDFIPEWTPQVYGTQYMSTLPHAFATREF